MKHFYFSFLMGLSALLLVACTPLGPGGGPLPGMPFVESNTEYLSGYGPPGARTYDPSARPQPNALGVNTKPSRPKPQGYWDDAGVEGSAKIRLKLAEQRAYFYKGGQLVGVSPISTGKDGYNTPGGTYRVTEKDIDHVSSVYGVIKDKATGQVLNSDADARRDRIPGGAFFENAPMPYFLRFNHGIGMHQGYLPGYPASHGCVRLPEHMARHFFHNAKLGTPVIVE